MHVTIHDTLGPADWDSRDFESPAEALEELGELLEFTRIRLSFGPGAPAGTSLPGLWRMVSQRLQDRGYSGEVEVRVAGPRVVDHFERYLPWSQRPRSVLRPEPQGLVVTLGDLAMATADAVVHASNRRLELGGGVSHAMRVRFGEGLQAQMWSVARTIEDGEGVVTEHAPSTGVRALYHVASAVGDPETVRACLETVARLARERGDARVILPALGTGTGGLEVTAFAQVLQGVDLGVTAELWCWTRSDYEDVLRAW